MSKYVDEIIEDLKNNPESFSDIGFGLKKEGIRLTDFGNGAILSIVNVEIDGREIPTTNIDCYRLEKAIKNWYKTISLSNYYEAVRFSILDYNYCIYIHKCEGSDKIRLSRMA